MTIVQITDLHIGRDGEDTFNTDVRKNFLNVLKLLEGINPEYIVLTGDLCFNRPDASIYEWIYRQMESLGIPYDIISGNHDDPVMMAGVFERESLLKEGKLYFSRELPGCRAIFLDTTSGEVSRAQLSWMNDQLTAEREKKVLLFMHHPPLFGGVPYMDQKYPLTNREAVQELLFQYPYPIHVFSGHYHVDKIIQRKNVTLHITPSCFFQIDQYASAFAVDHRRPGMRVITLNEGRLMSAVKYAEELPLIHV